jgi:ABC-type antimicrobial peptide transport system permease subunit
VITATGSALGLCASLLANRLLAALLYEVTPTDPVTLAAVTGILMGVAALATLIPARWSTRIDPMMALRTE